MTLIIHPLFVLGPNTNNGCIIIKELGTGTVTDNPDFIKDC